MHTSNQHHIQRLTIDQHLVDIQLDHAHGYQFCIPSQYRGQINLLITQSVHVPITFFCADRVDATIRLIVLFAQVVDVQVRIVMCGEQSTVSFLGMCAIGQQQVVTIKTEQIHCGKNSKSHLVVQGLVTDQARLMYDGLIRIEKDASGTHALQNNKNILLSCTATAISIPNIEVLNHDVQCYHGTAIGKFDEAQMCYMQSRGLDAGVIRALLVQELFAQVLQGYEKREFILQRVYENL